MDIEKPEYPQSLLRMFEVDFERPTSMNDYAVHVRKVHAFTHHEARLFVIENNRVGRIVRSVNRGPAK